MNINSCTAGEELSGCWGSGWAVVIDTSKTYLSSIRHQYWMLMIDECYTRLIWSGKVNPIFLILLIPKSFWCKYPPKLKITSPGSDIKAVHFHLLNIKLFLNSFPGKTGKIALARGSQGNPPSYISIPNLPTPSASQPSPAHTLFPLVGFAACLQGGLAPSFR